MKAETGSFVCELPIKVNKHERKVLSKRFEAARHMYNAALGESLNRLKLMRESRIYQRARTIPKGKARTKAFADIRRRYGFTEYDLHKYATDIRRSWLGDHLDAHTAQKIATRAYQAADQYALGKRGRPRFKGKGRLRSVEGKSNAAGIRYRDGYVCWKSLKLRCLIEAQDPVITYGLSSDTKYVRLIRKNINGRELYYAQLVCEGRPYIKEKNKIGSGVVGVDPGLSGVAAVSLEGALLLELSPGLKDKKEEVRKLQRALDRKRRAVNPQNYNDDGTVKKGAKVWHLSNSYIKNREAIAEVKRREAAQRKSENNRIANEILRMGDIFKIEENSYRSFQRNYGKSVGRRSPGGMMCTIVRKAESAGGTVQVFPTKTTKLSRSCICGKEERKSLQNRWHVCECGVVAQRDLFSAYLSMFVNERKRLDISQAQKAWAGVGPFLWQAMSSLEKERASGREFPASFGLGRRRSPSSVDSSMAPIEAGDVVAAVVVPVGESTGEVEVLAGTPRL